tara:strand:+ start:1469 stop:2104 length:636 start_codon:yes stop_codon:yes gene_type:complete
MNIFRLHDDPYIAAQMHCDKHVVKMILETAQMLSTAYRVLGSEKLADEEGLYKIAHKNHPSCVWIRNDVWNYYWSVSLLSALCAEYTYRYGKHHVSERLLHYFQKHVPNGIEMKAQNMPFPQCMPDEYKVEGDPVSAYRKYYKGEKAYFAKWNRGREAPEWWKNGMQEFVEHFATTEELLERAFSNDRHTIHESIRDDNKETNQQESICQN